MLILVRSSTKQKIYFAVRLLVIIALLSLILVQLSGLFNGYTFSSSGWLKEDSPSGNSLRVEQVKKAKHNLIEPNKNVIKKEKNNTKP